MAFLPVDADGDGAGGATRRCRSRCARSRPQQRVSLFVNEKPLATLEVDAAEQALRRRRARGAAARRRQPRSAAPSRARPTSPGGKRAAAAVTSLALGPARRGPPDRPARAASRRARSTSAARAGARWCRAAQARGSRSTSSCPRARTWRSRTAPPTPGRHGAGAGRRRRQAGAHRCTRATSARAGPMRSSISAPPAARRRASISSRAARRATSPGPSRASSSRRRAAPRPPTPAAEVRPHLRLDGRHAARRQAARLQPEDARHDAQLRRLRRRRDPLRLGAGPRHLVAAVARVAADRRLPDRAPGDRARGAPVQGRALRRRGA